MKLNELLKLVNIITEDESEVTGISDDSRQIKPGYIFVVRVGSLENGNIYIQDALENGALYILDVTNFKNYKSILLTLAMAIHQVDVTKLKIIGVTGTNGKTTTTSIIYQLLQDFKRNTMLIGTNGVFYNNEYIQIENTTPSNIKLIELLGIAIKKKIEFIVMEVSSHALSQERIYGIKFDYIVYLNLGQDHLDYHLSILNYLETKKKILQYANDNAIVISNIDDEYGKEFNLPGNTFFYGLNGGYLHVYDLNLSLKGSSFKIYNQLFRTNLIGKFNIYNILPSIIIMISLNYSLKAISNALTKVKSPNGRMELIYDNDFKVYIDFAHTQQALYNILTTLKMITKNRIVCLFGCGGNRDKSKRLKMGEIASKYADKIIVTTDNPRNEKPEIIIEDILKGCQANKTEVIIDRKLAIEYTIKTANLNDVILICGKGHEQYQIINNQKTIFNEKEIIYESINNFHQNNNK